MNRQEKTSFKIFHIYYNRMKKKIHNCSENDKSLKAGVVWETAWPLFGVGKGSVHSGM